MTYGIRSGATATITSATGATVKRSASSCSAGAQRPACAAAAVAAVVTGNGCTSCPA